MYWISDPLPYIFPALQIFDIFKRGYVHRTWRFPRPMSRGSYRLPVVQLRNERSERSEFRDGFHLQKWWTYGWLKNQTWWLIVNILLIYG